MARHYWERVSDCLWLIAEETLAAQLSVRCGLDVWHEGFCLVVRLDDSQVCRRTDQVSLSFPNLGAQEV